MAKEPKQPDKPTTPKKSDHLGGYPREYYDDAYAMEPDKSPGSIWDNLAQHSAKRRAEEEAAKKK